MSIKAMTIPAIVTERFVRGRAAANMLLVVTASALIAIAAQVAIPLPPVPMTLQPLAVIFIGVALGSTRGAAAAALYLLEGASGLPVFAEGKAGAIWLTGFTGGYLMSYPLAAWVAGFISERGWGSSMVRAVSGMLLALGIIYICGWSWFATLTNPAFAFARGVEPFILPDIIKVAIGAALLPKAQQLVARI